LSSNGSGGARGQRRAVDGRAVRHNPGAGWSILYISLTNAFNLGGAGSPSVRGNGQDIVRLTSIGDTYEASLWWDGSAAGFPVNIDALALER
jgi:hypothetical protein